MCILEDRGLTQAEEVPSTPTLGKTQSVQEPVRGAATEAGIRVMNGVSSSSQIVSPWNVEDKDANLGSVNLLEIELAFLMSKVGCLSCCEASALAHRQVLGEIDTDSTT